MKLNVATITTFLLTIFFFSSLSAQPVLVWKKTFGTPLGDTLNEGIATLDGGIAFTGSQGSDFWTTKISSDGEIEWEQKYNHPGFAHSQGNTLTQLKDETIVTGGSTLERFVFGSLSNQLNGLLLKYSNEGLQLDAITDQNHVASPVLINTEINCIRAFSDSTTIGMDKYIGKFGNDYNLEFFNPTGSDAEDIIPLENEYFLYYNVRKLICDTLANWVPNCGEYYFPNLSVKDILPLGNNEFLLVGRKNNDLSIVKTNLQGETLWEKTYGGSALETGSEAVKLPNGDILIGATTNSQDGDVTGKTDASDDLWLVLTDPDGNLKWNKTYGGTDTDYCESLAMNSQGEIFLFGNTKSRDGSVSGFSGIIDAWILKFELPNLVVELGADKTICEGNQIVLDAGIPNQSYLWSNGEMTQTISVNAQGNYSVTVTNASGGSGSDSILINLESVVVDLGGDQSICSMTSLDANNPGSTFLWSTGETTQIIDIQPVGEVWVQVTSTNGCVGSDTVFINNSSGISAIADVSQPNCFGDFGNITLQVQGGSGNYQYQWSNNETSTTVTNLAAGDYNVTISDPNSGCSLIERFTIHEPQELVVTISSTSICESFSLGNISTKVERGTAPYDYQWSNNTNQPSQIDLPSGDYTVTVTDANGCQKIAQTTIAQSDNQSPDIEWSRNFGGSQDEQANDVIQTQDGGYIVIGSTTSIDNQISQNKGGSDIWVIKLTPCGEMEWEKTYGGSEDDFGTNIVQVSDGSYFIGGSSESLDGDINDNIGDRDGIIIHINEQGEIIWSKNYGTEAFDNLKKLKLIQNGQLISLLDSSLEGVETNTNKQIITFINQDGSIDFTRNITGRTGTNLSASYNYFARDIIETNDGGVLTAADYEVWWRISGVSSWIEFNKLNSQGDWIREINKWGEPEGSFYKSGIQVEDSGFLFVGAKNSDGMLLKISSEGVTENLKSFPEFHFERVIRNQDGGFFTLSFPRGNSFDTIYDISINLIDQVKFDIAHSVTIGSPSQERGTSIAYTNDKGLIVSGSSKGIGGDVIENFGGSDFWIVKLKGNNGSLISLTDFFVNQTCFEQNTGKISLLNVSGGIPPYNYIWDTGDSTPIISSLGAGLYEVTITDSDSNTFVKTFEIETRDKIELEPDVDPACLYDDLNSISLPPFRVMNAQEPFQYLWSTGKTGSSAGFGLDPGIYSLTFTDANECVVIDSFEVFLDSIPIEFTFDILPACSVDDFGSIEVKATGGIPPLRINFFGRNPQRLQPSNSNYSFAVLDSFGCSPGIINFNIPLNDLEIETSIIPDSTQFSAIATPSGGIPPFSFLWNTTPPQIDSIATGLAVGTYEVEVTDSTGCSTSETVTIESTSLVKNQELNLLTLYPNPSFGECQIKINSPKAWQLQLTDNSGKLLQTESGIGDKQLIFSDLPKGVYLVNLEVDNRRLTKKLVILP